MGATTEGKNKRLGVHYHGETPVSPWYVGLIFADDFDTLATGDTPASHAGWTEFTGYNEAARPAWNEAAPAGGAMNGDNVVFTFTAVGRVIGWFLCSVATKGGTTGIFDQVELFSDEIQRAAGETLKLKITARG